MRHLHINIIVVLLASLSVMVGKSAVPVASTTSQTGKGIVILHENDVHCAYKSGYLTMDRMRNSIADTAWVATVGVGDFVQGDAAGAISKGEYILDIMRTMRYDAVTIGNHEFDYGISKMHSLLPTGRTSQVQTKSLTPTTCANYFNTAADTLVYAPYIMRQYGAKKIAYVGVITAGTLSAEGDAFEQDGVKQPYTITDGDRLIADVQKAVDEARRNGADYVIVLAHLGDNESEPYLTAQALVTHTRGIDALLDGHTHKVHTKQIANLDGKLIPVTQTGTKFANIGKLFISPDGKITSEVISLGDASAKYTASASQSVTDAVSAVNKKEASLDSLSIGKTDFDLRVDDADGVWLVRSQETNMADFVTDALRLYSGADIAFMQGGGIRKTIKAGNISSVQVIGVFPFFNDMELIKATGEDIKKTIEACSSSMPDMSGKFAQVSGLKYTIDTTTSPVSVTDIQVLDTTTGTYSALNPAKTYTIVSSKYFITGSEYGRILENNTVVKRLSMTDNDMLMWYIKDKLAGVVPEKYRNTDGRITIIHK